MCITAEYGISLHSAVEGHDPVSRQRNRGIIPWRGWRQGTETGISVTHATMHFSAFYFVTVFMSLVFAYIKYLTVSQYLWTDALVGGWVGIESQWGTLWLSWKAETHPFIEVFMHFHTLLLNIFNVYNFVLKQGSEKYAMRKHHSVPLVSAFHSCML